MYLIDEITVPTMTPDTSYILASIDEDGTRHYEVTDYYSPGYENTEEGFLAYRSANAMASGFAGHQRGLPRSQGGHP